MRRADFTSIFIAPCRRRSGSRACSPCSSRKDPAPRAPRRWSSASAPSWPDSASRSVLARPRVRCFSSRVTRKLGHIVPASNLRQWPLLLHISTALAKPPVGSPPVPGARERLGARIVLHVPRRPVERRLVRRSSGSPAGSGTARASSIVGGSHDLAGIEQACRIEQVLDRLERLGERAGRTARRPIRRGTRPSPCSPRVGALVLAHQRRGFLGDRAHLGARRRGACRGSAARAACRPRRGRTRCRACRACANTSVSASRVVGEVLERHRAVLDEATPACRRPSGSS